MRSPVALAAREPSLLPTKALRVGAALEQFSESAVSCVYFCLILTQRAVQFQGLNKELSNC